MSCTGANDLQAEKNLAWEAAQQNNRPDLDEGVTSRVNISNLLPELAESDITPIFAPFGPIVNVALVRNATGRSLGYGHVEYANRDDALRAVSELHGMELGGLIMRCKMSTVETANRAKGVKLAEVAAAAAQQAIAMGGNLSAALAKVGVPMGATAGLSTDGAWLCQGFQRSSPVLAATVADGFHLGAAGRTALMERLARGAEGINVPQPGMKLVSRVCVVHVLSFQCMLHHPCAHALHSDAWHCGARPRGSRSGSGTRAGRAGACVAHPDHLPAAEKHV